MLMWKSTTNIRGKIKPRDTHTQETSRRCGEHMFHTDNEALESVLSCIPHQICLISGWRVLTTHTHTHTIQGITCKKVNQLGFKCSVMKAKPSSQLILTDGTEHTRIHYTHTHIHYSTHICSNI